MKVSLVGVLTGTADQTLLIISIIFWRNLPVNIQVSYYISSFRPKLTQFLLTVHCASSIGGYCALVVGISVKMFLFP